MTLSGPLKWHGGKQYLAPKIIALMPPHIHYVEPYFGGGAVLLAKNPEGVSEVVNDIHADLTNFWRVLQNIETSARFRLAMLVMPFSEPEFDAAVELLAMQSCHHEDGPCVNCANRFFIRCRQSLAGRMKDFAILSRRRTRRGMNEQASAWLTAIEGLPEVHERLKRVVILNHDALEVIRQQDGPDTLFYCDPPYLHETRASPDAYQHEMTVEQHRQLLEVLCGLEGKFLLSGYLSPLYNEYAGLQGWNRHDFDLPNNAAGGEEKRRMRECVWKNY